MATPAVNCLLEAFPESEFHLLTSADGGRVMAGYHERLTRFWSYSRRFPRRLLLQRSLLRQLKAEGYGRVYIFEAKSHYRHWLAEVAPEVFALAGNTDHGHYSDRCLDLVAGTLDIPPARGWATLPLAEEGREKARRLLTQHGVDPAARLVGLHPTFSGTGLPFFRDRRGNRHRKWPAESFAELARILAERARTRNLNLALLVDALPGERKFVQPIIEGSGGEITLLTAPPDFQRYKGFLSLLDVLVTPNTGPMHMAAALGTPLVALFSRWDPADCGPYMDPARFRVLRAEQTGEPKLGLAAIQPETVAGAVFDLFLENKP